MNQSTYKQAYGRNLPHIQPPAATLFVTFRLAGSIPRSVMDEWLREKRRLTAEQSRRVALGQAVDTGEQLTFQRRWFRKFESLLHTGKTGPLWLGEPRVAELVREALHYRDGKVYRLNAFCIMPNHVHVVFAPRLSEAQAREMAIEQWRQKRSGFQARQARNLGGMDGRQLSGGQPPQPDRLRYQADVA